MAYVSKTYSAKPLVAVDIPAKSGYDRQWSGYQWLYHAHPGGSVDTVQSAMKAAGIDQATMEAKYGWALTVFYSNPELAQVFATAVAKDYTPQMFQAAVQNTKWYQTTSASARAWAILSETDKATAAAQTTERKLTVQLISQQLGTTMDAATLNQMATDSLLFGWTSDQIKSNLAQHWTYQPGTAQKGLAATAMDTINKATQDYLVPVSDQTKQTWAQQIMSGYSSPADYLEYAKTQAKSLFPALAAAIDQGLTVNDYADPYRQIASQTLGINANSVSFMDPQWRKAIDQVDPKTGNRTVMTLADWTTMLKKDPVYGWDKTPQAATEAANLTTKLAQMFGALG
jgi:hypothetical protein